MLTFVVDVLLSDVMDFLYAATKTYKAEKRSMTGLHFYIYFHNLNLHWCYNYATHRIGHNKIAALIDGADDMWAIYTNSESPQVLNIFQNIFNYQQQL